MKYVELTPKSIRIRKIFLKETDRNGNQSAIKLKVCKVEVVETEHALSFMFNAFQGIENQLTIIRQQWSIINC